MSSPAIPELELFAIVSRWSIVLGLIYAITLTFQRHATFEDSGIISSVINICKFLILLIIEEGCSFATQSPIILKVIFILSVVFVAIFVHGLYIECVAGNNFKKEDLNGKAYIVTGCNTGIGYETAKQIAAMNGVVIMACRSLDKANIARNEILQSTKCSPTKVIVLKLDLCGFDSVRKFVKEFRLLGLPLHGLINNAGVMMEERNLTQDGFEMVFTANHLSHFLLTNLLLPDLEKTSGRVVVLSSALHKSPHAFNFEDVMSVKSYSLFGTYSQSKLANVMFAFELQRRLSVKGSAVTCNAVHPGIVLTEVTRNMNAILRIGYKLCLPVMLLLQKTPSQGARTSLYVATSSALTGVGGKYFYHCEAVAASAPACDPEAGKRLWSLSERLTGLVAGTVQ